MNIKKWMWWFIAIFTLIIAICSILNIYLNNKCVSIIFIILLPLYFMCCIKPFFGAILNIKKNGFNYKNKWFKVHKFEIKIYDVLKVKKWKNILPTYNKKSYDLSSNSLIEIANTMCKAEVAHEIMFIISFIPMFLMFAFPKVFIYLIVICSLSAVIDLLLIMIQRYNRNRIVKLINRNADFVI